MNSGPSNLGFNKISFNNSNKIFQFSSLTTKIKTVTHNCSFKPNNIILNNKYFQTQDKFNSRIYQLNNIANSELKNNLLQSTKVLRDKMIDRSFDLFIYYFQYREYFLIISIAIFL